MLLVQRIDLSALVDQIRDNVGVIKHAGAVQRSHLLHICAAQTDALLQRLHVKHELDYLNGALRGRRNRKREREKESVGEHRERRGVAIQNGSIKCWKHLTKHYVYDFAKNSCKGLGSCNLYPVN